MSDEYVPKCPRCGEPYKIVESESKRVYLVQVTCPCGNFTAKFPVKRLPKDLLVKEA